MVQPFLDDFSIVRQGYRQKRYPLVLDSLFDSFYVEQGAGATSYRKFIRGTGPE